MKTNAYTTYPLTGHDVSAIADKLKEEYLRSTSTIVHLRGRVHGVIQDNKYVPAFNHPIEVEVEKGYFLYFVDLRTLATKNPEPPYYRVRNQSMHDIQLVRAILEHEFKDDPYKLRECGPLPLLVWNRMLSDAIVRRCSLRPEEIVRVSAVAAVFYYSLFEDDGVEKWEGDDWVRVTMRIGTLTRIGSDVIGDIWDGRTIKSVDQFVAACKEVVNGTGIEILNPALLFNLIGSFKMGLNMREIIPVALEHPPTWLALVWDSTRNRSDDQMYRVVSSLNRNGVGRQLEHFVKNFSH